MDRDTRKDLFKTLRDIRRRKKVDTLIEKILKEILGVAECKKKEE